MKKEISDRRKRGENKQIFSRKTNKRQNNHNLKVDHSRSVVWGNLKKREDQEELVGDGTDVQTFLRYPIFQAVFEMKVDGSGLPLFLVRCIPVVELV